MVRYDPLLARALARDLGARRKGARVASVRLLPSRRAARVDLEGGVLLFLLHPEAGHVLDLGSHAAAPSLDAGEEIRIRRLFLADVRTPPDERTLLLTLADARGRSRHRIALELMTNQWNLLWLSPRGDGWRIDRALWPRDAGGRRLRPGAPYEALSSDRRGAEPRPTPPAEEEWTESLIGVPPAERRGAALRGWAWLSSLNVEWVLGRATDRELDEAASRQALRTAARRYAALVEAARERLAEDEVADRARPEGGGAVGGPAGKKTPEAGPVPGGWLLARAWGPQPYPLRLGDEDASPAASCLDAMDRACEGEGGPVELLERAAQGETAGAGAGEAARLESALRERRESLRRRRDALGRELQGAADPEQPRGIGHLLLARKGRVPRGASTVRLPGFDGSEREVELDPALDVVANAERYFDEARRRERARTRLPKEIEEAGRAVRAVERGLERLEREGPDDELWALAGGRPEPADGPADGDREEARLPYQRFRSSGGLEIRVGRGAKDNDELTFRHSSPEDVWLHARQVQGAHVILRWGRKGENPPQRDLAEAAVAAAVHSGARHSGAVAVDWTRRKYVRKPRKAPPGAVLPERVRTLFVEPDEGLLDRLRRDA